MKKAITLASVLFCVAVSARELPPMPGAGNGAAGTTAFSIRSVPDKAGELSIQIGGYEMILEKDDTPGYHGFRKQVDIKRKKYSGRIRTYEFGFNVYDYAPRADYSMYPEDEQGFMDLNISRSGHYAFNIFTFSTALVPSQTLGVTIGLGLTANNYRLETPVRFEKQDRVLHPVVPDNYLKKAKLNTVALHIPLALEFNPTRKFFVSAGGYLDLMLGSHTKIKSPKEKLRGICTNFAQAGVTVRVGFKNLYLFGNYGLTELFRPGKGPGVNPCSFGFGFGF